MSYYFPVFLYEYTNLTMKMKCATFDKKGRKKFSLENKWM